MGRTTADEFILIVKKHRINNLLLNLFLLSYHPLKPYLRGKKLES
jgi:hypothetical protein